MEAPTIGGFFIIAAVTLVFAVLTVRDDLLKK
jgi:hypothetical protein